MKFSDQIIGWYQQNKRNLPWRGTTDPYKVWLSEIILQQTRVDQGLKYYLHFCETYPTVQDLASAPEGQVMKSWEGLGYYSRARNLHYSAKYICQELDGVFPETYKEILKLKGVGDYTASAISSFCFKEPQATVDGNVYRLLSRYFGIHTPIDSTTGKKEFKQLANELIPTTNPDLFNQSIMEFGSQQCKPANPDCEICPLSEQCVAYNQNTIANFPVKEKKTKQRTRYFDYLILIKDDLVLVRLRTQKDIWQKLNDFRLIESSTKPSDENIISKFGEQLAANKIIGSSNRIKHILSHQKLFVKFWQIEVEQFPDLEEGEKIVPIDSLTDIAFPRVIDAYLTSLSENTFFTGMFNN